MAQGDHTPGFLTIVGAGIRPGLHTTREAITRIRSADKVLYLLAEITPVRWLKELNPSAENLAMFFFQEVSQAIDDDRVRVHMVRVWETSTCSATYFAG